MAVELDDVDVKLRSAAGAGEPVRQGPAAAGDPPEAGPGQAAIPASACRDLRVGRPPGPPASPGAGPETDPYASGTCRWWHRTEPSPELVAAEATGALGKPGVVVDLGCGLGSELGYLAGRGWHGIGVDLSVPALARARDRHPGVTFACADVTSLPVRAGSADLLLDRGCFHYLPAGSRGDYAEEAARVLRPGGRLLLRMCLTSAGVPNGLDEQTISATFSAWQLASMTRTDLVSDTRSMPAILAILLN